LNVTVEKVPVNIKVEKVPLAINVEKITLDYIGFKNPP
jgi:hypothetical protein